MCSKSCDCKQELKDWGTSKKWWPNWIGFLLAIIAAIISIKWDSKIIKCSPWESNIGESNDINTIFGILCLFLIMCLLFSFCDYATNISLKRKEVFKKIFIHLRGFTVFYILSVFCFMIGSQVNMKQYGVGYAILSLCIGMFLINITYITKSSYWSNLIDGATSNGEFYIKCGLVLLATDLKTVIIIGAPGLIISWIIPPLIIIFMWYFGTKILKQTNKKFIIALSSGTAICGVSAICAVAAVVELSSEETATAVSILSFFTIIYMLVVPYIALYTNLNNIVAGAWIGGSVDGTGNVVASVGILDDDDAYETATLIKMAQNVLIGVVCLVITIIFNKQQEHSYTPVRSQSAHAINLKNLSDDDEKKESSIDCVQTCDEDETKSEPKIIEDYKKNADIDTKNASKTVVEDKKKADVKNTKYKKQLLKIK